MQLFDLAGREDDLRFSPYCWRVKMALRHKGLECEEIPWRYADKDRIAPSGQGRVPVLIDDGRWIHDSWAISSYLDDAYPDRPALMGTPEARTAARFFNFWCDQTLHPAFRPILLLDIYNAVAEQDKAYFRKSREEQVGMALEQYCAPSEQHLKTLRTLIAPMESTLGEFAFLGGEAPNFSDYVVFGTFQWANVISPKTILAPSSAAQTWFERMLDLFGGYGRRAPTVPKLAAA
jgi:glutathione S-transferase